MALLLLHPLSQLAPKARIWAEKGLFLGGKMKLRVELVTMVISPDRPSLEGRAVLLDPANGQAAGTRANYW
jgi:hypothetical protein